VARREDSKVRPAGRDQRAGSVRVVRGEGGRRAVDHLNHCQRVFMCPPPVRMRPLLPIALGWDNGGQWRRNRVRHAITWHL
jgi:hypothetical protein